MNENDKKLTNDGVPSANAEHEPLPIYEADSIQKPDADSHQMTTGDATRVEDANDTRVKNDAGPEHFAPVNPTFSPSFDEFAGDFAGETPVLLAERGKSDFAQHEEAYDFGHRFALDSRFSGREWSNAEAELQAEWSNSGRHGWEQWCPSVQMGWTRARGLG